MMGVLGLGRRNLVKVVLVAAAAVLAACVVALASMERPAEAAFPGSNGKLTFASNRDGNYEIYTMNADGSNQTRLTNNSEGDFRPAWSPDGSKIAFDSQRETNGPVQIYIMDADGSNQTRLTNNTADDHAPDWGLMPVVYAFSGFYQPVDNLPTLNKTKPGKTIPIRFSLGGDKGLDIFAN